MLFCSRHVMEYTFKMLLRSVNFRLLGAISPHSVCLYDVFAMYNEEQCRLRSISYATYEVIFPSGPHLAKCRPC